MNDSNGQQIEKDDMLFDLANGCFGRVTDIKVTPSINPVSNESEMIPRVYIEQTTLDDEKHVYDTHPASLMHVTPDVIAQHSIALHSRLAILNKVIALCQINMGNKITMVEFRKSKKTPKK